MLYVVTFLSNVKAIPLIDKDFKLLYMDTMMNDYKFMVKKNNKAFYDLFNYIIIYSGDYL